MILTNTQHYVRLVNNCQNHTFKPLHAGVGAIQVQELTMQQTERPIKLQEGMALVNDSGRCVTIKSVNDGTAICDDSNFRREQKYECNQLIDGVHNDDFRIVENSKLTEIKGIGEATAPVIEAKTGCQTPSELAYGYLAGKYDRDVIRRTDYFKDWLLTNVDELSLDIEKAKVKVTLFCLELGCNVQTSDLQNIDGMRTTGHSINGDKLTTEHIKWHDSGVGVWVDTANVMCIARGVASLTDLQSPDIWNELQPCDSHERDGDHHLFTVDGGETLVSGDYFETLGNIFDVPLFDIKCHPDGEYPILVEDRDTDLVIALAPRVQ